jgi:hypothetical protein
MNFYQCFILLRDGFFYFFELKDIRSPVFCANNRLHKLPLYPL